MPTQTATSTVWIGPIDTGAHRVKSAYFDGELCALNFDGVPMFSRLQAAMDKGRTDQLVFFDLRSPILEWAKHGALPLIEQKEKLARLFRR